MLYSIAINEVAFIDICLLEKKQDVDTRSHDLYELSWLEQESNLETPPIRVEVLPMKYQDHLSR